MFYSFFYAVGLWSVAERPHPRSPARQHFDDQRCAAKYGPLWVEYCRRVRWRIVPGLY